jgi:antitoxin component of MazEF toxin-antitoxin module
MIAKVEKFGNNKGIHFPIGILKNFDLNIGDILDIEIMDDKIVIETKKNRISRYRIEELVKMMPDDYKPTEEDWGEPVGREVR